MFKGLSIHAWLNATHPEELKKLIGPDGKLVYAREAVARLVRLAGKYRDLLTVIKSGERPREKIR